jgi:hypothetical protein
MTTATRPAVRQGGSGLLLAAVALLGGYVLFCHGCHGDEDNELLAAASPVSVAAPASAPAGQSTAPGPVAPPGP